MELKQTKRRSSKQPISWHSSFKSLLSDLLLHSSTMAVPWQILLLMGIITNPFVTLTLAGKTSTTSTTPSSILSTTDSVETSVISTTEAEVKSTASELKSKNANASLATESAEEVGNNPKCQVVYRNMNVPIPGSASKKHNIRMACTICHEDGYQEECAFVSKGNGYQRPRKGRKGSSKTPMNSDESRISELKMDKAGSSKDELKAEARIINDSDEDTSDSFHISPEEYLPSAYEPKYYDGLSEAASLYHKLFDSKDKDSDESEESPAESRTSSASIVPEFDTLRSMLPDVAPIDPDKDVKPRKKAKTIEFTEQVSYSSDEDDAKSRKGNKKRMSSGNHPSYQPSSQDFYPNYHRSSRDHKPSYSSSRDHKPSYSSSRDHQPSYPRSSRDHEPTYHRSTRNHHPPTYHQKRHDHEPSYHHKSHHHEPTYHHKSYDHQPSHHHGSHDYHPRKHSSDDHKPSYHSSEDYGKHQSESSHGPRDERERYEYKPPIPMPRGEDTKDCKVVYKDSPTGKGKMKCLKCGGKDHHGFSEECSIEYDQPTRHHEVYYGKEHYKPAVVRHMSYGNEDPESKHYTGKQPKGEYSDTKSVPSSYHSRSPYYSPKGDYYPSGRHKKSPKAASHHDLPELPVGYYTKPKYSLYA